MLEKKGKLMSLAIGNQLASISKMPFVVDSKRRKKLEYLSINLLRTDLEQLYCEY